MEFKITPVVFNGINSKAVSKGIRGTEKNSADAVLTDALDAIGAAGRSLVKKSEPNGNMPEIKAKRVRSIKNIIRRKIHKGENITIDEIARRMHIPKNQVITLIYRGTYPEVQELFDQVKDAAKLAKPVSGKSLALAKYMVASVPKYTAAEDEDIEIIEAENDYIKSFAKAIQRAISTARWPDEVFEAFKEGFAYSPAFADMMITTKNKKFHTIRNFTSADAVDKLFETHSLNPELTEELYEELGDNGSFKYPVLTLCQIVTVGTVFPELLEMAKTDPKNIFWLATLTDKEGNQRFVASEIKALYEWLIKEPDITKRLIQEFTRTKVENGAEKCTPQKPVPEEIDENETEDTENVQPKKKRPTQSVYKYNGEDILYILKHYESDPKLVLSLIEERYDNSLIKKSREYVITVLKSKEKATNNGLLWNYNEFTNKKELKKNPVQCKNKNAAEFCEYISKNWRKE